MRWIVESPPQVKLLCLMAAAMPMAFSTWMVVINNFAVERAAFSGAEIGILQSLREVPGFMAFAVVLFLPFIREQKLALLSLALLGVGTAITGLFPSVLGLYFTTVIASVGFHYYETVNQSLQLQWLDRDRAGELFGRLLSVGALSGLVAYALVFASTRWWGVSLEWVLAAGGMITLAVAVYCASAFAQFEQPVEQRKTLILRKRYSLYYLLTFLSGARRQIFVVFAAFLMVEKFGFSASSVALMYLANGALNFILAPYMGAWIDRVGERRALTVEYIGLILVFVAYAVVEHAAVAVALFIIDHALFALAISLKTYFQKIADPADIAPTAGVAFTINHIAAVGLPAVLGFLWVSGSSSAVFLIGALFAALSLLLAQVIPTRPARDAEMRLPERVLSRLRA
ncbi:MAG: MFS transporter [Pseudomonadota bacterium]